MEFKKILLLKLPYCEYEITVNQDFRTKTSFLPVPSIGLAALSAFLNKYGKIGYCLEVIDINIEAYTIPGEPIDITCYHELLLNSIKNAKYDVLALSAMFIYNEKWIDKAVALSRKYHPNAKIIIGGIYATLFPDRIIERNHVDDVVIGEGEATFLHILNKYNGFSDIEFESMFPFDGYCSKNETGEVVFSKKKNFIDMEYIPEPAWSDLNVEEYFKKSGDYSLPIEASRGCPYNCSYCSTYLQWGRKIRYKPVQNMVKEVSNIKKQYDIATHFIDDNLTFDKDWITSVLTQLINGGLTNSVTAQNFSIKHLDEKIIDLFVQAGCEEFTIAIESGSPAIQKITNKKLVFDDVRKIVKLFQIKKLRYSILWMIGFPGETLDQISETFAFARELKSPFNQFAVVLPYPGTKMFNEAQKKGLLNLDDADLSKFDCRNANYIKSDEWDIETLQDMIYDFNIETNFIYNSMLNSDKTRDYFYTYLKNLLLKLPDHIIARIVLGYICKCKKMDCEKNEYYLEAVELLKNKSLNKTFGRYLSWESPVIKDFKLYMTNYSNKI